jgi:hypothetical protein
MKVVTAMDHYFESQQIFPANSGIEQQQLQQIAKCPRNPNKVMLELVCKVIGVLVKCENASKYI